MSSRFSNVSAQDRRGYTPVSIVLRKSVRFFIINIWKMVWTLLASYILYNMKIDLDEIISRFERLHPRRMKWPISFLNDGETQERGL